MLQAVARQVHPLILFLPINTTAPIHPTRRRRDSPFVLGRSSDSSTSVTPLNWPRCDTKMLNELGKVEVKPPARNIRFVMLWWRATTWRQFRTSATSAEKGVLSDRYRSTQDGLWLQSTPVGWKLEQGKCTPDDLLPAAIVLRRSPHVCVQGLGKIN